MPKMPFGYDQKQLNVRMIVTKFQDTKYTKLVLFIHIAMNNMEFHYFIKILENSHSEISHKTTRAKKYVI